ncbi:hypothetical protein [Methylobacter tundripaludum]|uniref:Uncharacterized protein n=1 Tax=Methylobacter tundripaludum (strain ATCC BAA-1195 / DSM 17260 / SV96) TaxID=697282 RepID=G3IWS6_METTV|nr:hypothetical protein [Methylobacter tundripaludum]EGW23135.1 hypothetical protein Mettu_1975 [Methylobacter tundripaludum SV96]
MRNYLRVILVERTGEGDWLNKIVGTGTTKAQVNATHAPNLPLATISDSWPIFEFVLNKVKKPVPDKAETLATFGAIDPERRPLFAYFMADAIAAGHDVRHFDAARLLDQVIERGREAYWKPVGATAKEERLLALATMAGGLPVSSVKGMKEELLSSWNVDFHPKVFLAMTGRESGESVSPLEPDIVGEHFALACLAQTNLSNEDRSRLCGLAWQLGSHSMAQFILRAHRDLPTHPMLNWVRKLPTSEGLPQFFWAVAAVNLMVDLGSSDPDAARALLDDLRRVATARDEPTVWREWAKAAHNLMLGLQSRDPDAGRALLNDIRSMATVRDEIALWELWSKAAANLMFELQSCDQDAAQALAAEVLLLPPEILSQLGIPASEKNH